MSIAHINKNNKIQTVAEHSYGTELKSVRYAEKLNMVSIAKLASLLHDIGKLCNDFEKYIKGENNMVRGDIDHCYAGAKYVCEMADEMGAEYYDVSRFIAHIIVSHHGLHDWYDKCGEDYLSKRCSNDKRYSEIKGNINEIADTDTLKNLLIKAREEYKAVRIKIVSMNKLKSCRAFYLGLFERLMQSVLVDADRTDTANFMYETETEKIFSDDELQKIWINMNNALENKLEEFKEKTDSISLQRRSISDRCKDFAKNEVGICRLIVPTGGGKTLSSMRFAVNYGIKHEHKIDKIIYVAPYMSILEQNSDVISSISGAENFIEHHSNILIEKDNYEEYSEYELRTEKWDLPVIATTMVQFFNTIFSAKMQSVRRMHRLANSVIIIDEVQSVPIKCINMFNLAMNFLSKICGCTIVLCSATQPSFEDVQYPLMIDENDSITGDCSLDFQIFKRTDIIPKIVKYGMTYEEVAEFCHQEYEKAGNILVILNTKKSAKTIYELMKDMSYSNCPRIIHLSTNMCPAHRRKIIKDMKTYLNEPIICITTQLIEAGVDISFKCVVRSLAGLDNAVQAAGRCNRHGENPEICPVYVVNIKDEQIGKLKDIQKAHITSYNIIQDNSEEDLSNQNILSKYYKELFKSVEKDMNYSIPEENENLITLISTNKNRYSPSSNNKNIYFAQAFKTAGTAFDFIDSPTIGVIVPYNDEAEEMICELESDIEPRKAIQILRKLQQYTVNVYRSMLEILKQNEIIRLTASKTNPVYILRKENYNSETGIELESSEMEFLNF